MPLTWNRINPKMSQDFLTFLLPRIKCFLTIGKMVDYLVEYGGLMVYMSQFYSDYIYIWQNGSECWNNSPKKKKKKTFCGTHWFVFTELGKISISVSARSRCHKSFKSPIEFSIWKMEYPLKDTFERCCFTDQCTTLLDKKCLQPYIKFHW